MNSTKPDYLLHDEYAFEASVLLCQIQMKDENINHNTMKKLTFFLHLHLLLVAIAFFVLALIDGIANQATGYSELSTFGKIMLIGFCVAGAGSLILYVVGVVKGWRRKQ